ncbi:MAG: type II secretion system protein GspF [Myxococcales bacterium]|nr:MAG: type II secretion system protein GspF [Myxococcales bacterium]
MPVFEWKGLDEKGKPKKGILDSDSARTAKERLKKQGVFLTEIREAAASGSSSASGGAAQSGSLLSRQIDFKRYFQTVSQQEVAIITRLLANLIAANIPIVESLTAIVDQVENEQFKTVLSKIREAVNEGSSLSDAMAQYPKLFPPLYTNMVRAGESSGALDVVMDRLADYTESQMTLRTKIRGAMTYPVIMMLFAIIVVGILFVFVIPKISKIFEDAKIALPFTTRILIAASEFAASYWWLILAALVGAWIGFGRWRKSKNGRPAWDRFVLHAPVFGELVRMVAVSRFARTLATLLSSGVPLLAAMDIVKNILNNTLLMQVLEKARDDIREGESIAKPLKASGEFPPIVTHMIAIGEKSGQLEEMLNHVSRNYDVQVESKLGALTSLLEPVMIIVMGLVVTFIVLSILLPILQINQQLGG